MPLNRKTCLWVLAALILIGALFLFKPAKAPHDAVAKIRIYAASQANPPSFILTQAKGITQQETMEELLRRLHLSHSDKEKNQKEILEILRHVTVEREGNSEIFNIRVRHQDKRWAKQISQELALAFQTAERQNEQKNAEAYLKDLDRQILDAKAAVEELELKLQEVKKKNTPSDIDITLARRLREKEAQYQALSATYTDLHPDIIDIKKQIDSLKAQIADGPALDFDAVDNTQAAFSRAEQHYSQLRQQRDDAAIGKEAVSGSVQIVELYHHTPMRKLPIPKLYWGLGLSLVFLLLILAYTSR